MKSRNVLLMVLGALLITACTAPSAAATTYTISVAVTGLTGTLVVQDSKGDMLTFTTNNTQTFAQSFNSGSSYTVRVKTQPSGQTCTLSSNSTGNITSNITVTATCTNTVVNYTISVAVTGLTGTLVAQDSKGDILTFISNNTQSFRQNVSQRFFLYRGRQGPACWPDLHTEQQRQRNDHLEHYSYGHMHHERRELHDQRGGYRTYRNPGRAGR